MEFHLLSNERPIEMAAEELKSYLTRMGSEEILPKSWELGVQDMTEYGLEALGILSWTMPTFLE